MPRSATDPGVVSSRRRTARSQGEPRACSLTRTRRSPCQERDTNASSWFRDHSGPRRCAVMTVAGHSKDARMLTEVTRLVNRLRIIDAAIGPSHAAPVCVDLLPAHRYARADDKKEKRVRDIADWKLVPHLFVQGQFQQTGRSG